MSRLRLLLLSGACLVGQNILACLADRRSGLWLSAMNSVAAEPALFDFDEAYLSGNVAEEPERFERRFRDVMEKTAPDLVIPCRDDDVSFLAQMKEKFPEQGDRFLCGTSASAEAMLDKLASWEFSVQADLPFAETISTEAPAAAIEAFADTHGFPLIMKPRHGFGSRDVFFLLNAEQLRRAIGRPDFVIQRYVGDSVPIRVYANAVATEGVPLFHTLEAVKPSIQSLIAPDGEVVGTFAANAIMRLGRDERTLLELDPQAKQLGESCAAAFSRIGWRGPLNLNCARDRDGQLRVFEFNGRFTGATAARRLLGYDEVWLALQTFCNFGGTSSADSLDWGETPSEVVRFPVGRVPDARNVHELLRTGYWRAAHAI